MSSLDGAQLAARTASAKSAARRALLGTATIPNVRRRILKPSARLARRPGLAPAYAAHPPPPETRSQALNRHTEGHASADDHVESGRRNHAWLVFCTTVTTQDYLAATMKGHPGPGTRTPGIAPSSRRHDA